LATDSQGLRNAVLEAVLVTAVRDGALPAARARRVLGLSRYEMDGLLKHHNALNEMTIEELERDTAAAAAFARE